jgi:hypothetical protein
VLGLIRFAGVRGVNQTLSLLPVGAAGLPFMGLASFAPSPVGHVASPPAGALAITHPAYPGPGFVVGKDAYLVKRHDASGCTHGSALAPSCLDTHITGGSTTMLISALHEVYGAHLCASSLISMKSGNSRIFMCDMAGSCHHESLTSDAHQLPLLSGPHHSETWNRCLKLAGMAGVKNRAPAPAPAEKRKKKADDSKTPKKKK